MAKQILITGGAGYIGSHTCVQLLMSGANLTIVDNFSNSSPKVLDRIKKITGCTPNFVEGDITDPGNLEYVFSKYQFLAVVHFAGLKAVGESVEKPLSYYRSNVSGTINLLEAMNVADVRTFIFSSSATVYGDPECLPITENALRSATNPYGRSKLIVEEILADLYHSDPRWKIACLRYFNPVGAHASGLIGESPQGIPNNLMPFISQVACRRRSQLSVFGNDYPTPDGTGVRDYIHVEDLAAGHLAALNYLQSKSEGEWLAVNLGTGCGFSVLEMIKAFEAESGQAIPFQISNRRPGDIAACYADSSLAKKLFGWEAKRGIDKMCADTWRWQSNNPNGYESQ